MAEIKATVTIEDGQVVRLHNISEDNSAIVHQGELSVVLKALSDEGWRLAGSYELELTKSIETDEERTGRIINAGKSRSTSPEVPVSARKRKT